MALAAELTLSVGKGTYYYNPSENTTVFIVLYNWRWNLRPTYTYKDVIGFGWSEGMYQDYSSSYHNVTYKNEVTGKDVVTYNIPVENVQPASNAKSTFDMDLYEFSWAYKGSGSMQVFKIGKIPICEMGIAYGHTTKKINPGIGYPWNIGFTFTEGTKEMARDTARGRL